MATEVKVSKKEMIMFGIIAVAIIGIIYISKTQKDKDEKRLGYRPSQFKKLMRNA